jgi:tRNA uridine 5-carbamoylmethylation protein Kti12
MKTKELFIIRGLPGSGKSTLAKSLGGKHVEADMFFMKDSEYKFDATKIKDAHSWCQNMVGSWMSDNEERIVVSNTFTQEWEMKSYLEWAEDFGYTVFSLIVENRHGGKNVHNVPEEVLDKMRERFEVVI